MIEMPWRGDGDDTLDIGVIRCSDRHRPAETIADQRYRLFDAA